MKKVILVMGISLFAISANATGKFRQLPCGSVVGEEMYSPTAKIKPVSNTFNKSDGTEVTLNIEPRHLKTNFTQEDLEALKANAMLDTTALQDLKVN